MAELFRKTGCEPCVLVRDQLPGDPVMWEDMLHIQPSDVFPSEGLVAKEEESNLGDVMICYCENGIKPFQGWQSNDQIYGDGAKGEHDGLWCDRVKWYHILVL